MAYASYSDYQGLYGGRLLDEEGFVQYASRADEYLELLTYGRCATPSGEAVAQAVRKACCAVAEQLYRQEQQPALRSHRVGQWSRTYQPGRSPEQAIADAARVHLTGTGLLWRGWKRSGVTL